MHATVQVLASMRNDRPWVPIAPKTPERPGEEDAAAYCLPRGARA